MPLEPRTARYLAEQAANPPPASATAAERRETMRVQRLMTIKDRTMAGPAGEIPLRIYMPAGNKALPILLYFHGGGFVVGDLDTVDFRCRLLADWAGCVVVSVDYRLAPEHPYPAAVEDCFAATVWAAEQAAALGADADRIAVGGDSAGGNLAAVVALLAKEHGGPKLCFQYLVYPVTDATTETVSYHENGSGYGLTKDAMVWYWDNYAPDLARRSEPYASPLRAPDLSGLPPALVVTAEFDPLRDEGEAYAARLREAGVPVELRRYDGMVHGFLGQTGVSDLSKQATIDSVAALRQAFEKEPSR